MVQVTNPHSSRLSLIQAGVLFSTLIFGLSGCGGGGGGSKPEMSIDSPTITEGADTETPTLTFTLTLSKAADSVLTVNVDTADGTAEAGEDYTARTGETLTIAAGDTSASFIIDITGDDDVEADETFSLQITNPQGLALDGSQSLTGTGTITNDDNADRGYFAGTGTLGGTAYSDLVALAYNPRILLFSPSANVLYDIDMTSYDGTDYSGDVDIYIDGTMDQTLAITGQTNGVELSGSFSDGTGMGFGEGSFSVTYDLDNNEGAGASTTDFSRIEATGSYQRWAGNLYGYDHLTGTSEQETGKFDVESSGDYWGVDDNDELCQFPNYTNAMLEIPDVDINIFKLSHAIDNQGIIGACAPPYESAGHTGFATVVDGTGGDSRLYFAFNNNDIALFGVMNK